MQIATPTTVAQAISFAIDDVQEHGTSDGEMGLFLDARGSDPTPEKDLRINEVGAQLHHLLGGNVEFEVKTSDGRTFRVRVSEEG